MSPTTMTKLPLLPAAFIAALLLHLPLAAQQPSMAAVDALFSRYASLQTPGCAVGVSRDGEPVLARGYGAADLEHGVANEAETIFEAGSVSKQFTAAAIVLLAQEGRLSLDDDVRRYLPELPDYGATITIRHLITHTSGLRDWGSVVDIEGWPRGTRVHDHEHVLAVAARQRSLNYPPGEFYSYTNTGYNLQAVIVERVSGMSFAEFSRTRIFVPLGLASTQWRDDYRRIVPRRAQAYSSTAGEYQLNMPFENVHGNGGLLTTVGDLLRWTDLLARGEIAGPDFSREMHRQARLNSGRVIEYAGGLFVTSHLGFDEVSHSGSTAGYRAYLARYPDHGVGVAVLCNAADANATSLAHGVAELYLPALREDEYAAAEVPPAELEVRAGIYRDARRGQPLRITLDGDRLRAGNSALVALSGERFRTGSALLEFDEFESGAARAAFRWIAADGDTVLYLPEADFAPTAAELEAFVGRYQSDEAEIIYTVEVEEGRLVLRRRYGSAAALTPAYGDAFTTGGTVIRFLRGGDGRVTGFSSISARVWDMRFSRVE